MWLVLLALGWRGGLGLPFQVSLGLVALLLLYVHLFRRSASLDAINQDFFLANIAVSVCVMAGNRGAVAALRKRPEAATSAGRRRCRGRSGTSASSRG